MIHLQKCCVFLPMGLWVTETPTVGGCFTHVEHVVKCSTHRHICSWLFIISRVRAPVPSCRRCTDIERTLPLSRTCSSKSDTVRMCRNSGNKMAPQIWTELNVTDIMIYKVTPLCIFVHIYRSFQSSLAPLFLKQFSSRGGQVWAFETLRH